MNGHGPALGGQLQIVGCSETAGRHDPMALSGRMAMSKTSVHRADRPTYATCRHRYEPTLSPGMRRDASTATPASTSPMPAIHATSPG
jgi:hypothetical protein